VSLTDQNRSIPTNEPCAVGADSSGSVYANQFFAGPVTKFADGSSTGTVLDPFGLALYVDPVSGEVYVDEDFALAVFYSNGSLKERIGSGVLSDSAGVAVNDSSGTVYVSNPDDGSIVVFAPIVVPDVTIGPVTNQTPTAGTLNGHVDPAGGGAVTSCHFEYGTDTSYSGPGSGTIACSPDPTSNPPSSNFTAPTDVTANLSGLTTETTYHYRLVASNANGTDVGADQTFTPHYVIGLNTEPATDIGSTTATLNASFVGTGQDTHYYFQWGTDNSYGNTTAVPPGVDVGSPTGPTSLPSVTLENLNTLTTYFYRVVASNSSGTSFGEPQSFTTLPAAPLVKESVSDVHSDVALLHAEINPARGDTKYHFEYGTSDCSTMPDPCTSVPATDLDIGSGAAYIAVRTQLSGLTPGTTYHWRVVATNVAGTGGSDRTFTTFSTGSGIDNCPNAHVRQQTGAAMLLDCRAYELVSASSTGGYDVESNLVPGQTPFGGYPNAENPPQVLYGVHNGGIPGTGHPTNDGVDPYVATRTENGWTTKYVGIPANDPFASAPFASRLEEADPGLDTFAFGGPDICSPCFEDHSTGLPIHLPNGELVQGMAGQIPQPTAKPEGFIGKDLSANGEHLVFGSKSKFEPDANEGEVSIYDRNLNTEETHVVSKTPAGQTMKAEGTEIGELDVSKDGSRIVIGHLVEEVGGAKYWHLYMDIGDEGKTIDLTPGTTHGVLFDGMTEDGSKVFFSSVDHLTGQESAHSGPDIFEAEVSEAATPTLHLISKGQEEEAGKPGDTASCDPVANSAHLHWNTAEPGAENCGVVAIGGGGGVASGDGTIYFLSPEKLDGASNGVQDAPNLYVARPGQPPHFVATLESVLSGPQPRLLRRSFGHNFGSFTDATGLAVDHSSGDLYVLDAATNTVKKFDSSGNLVETWGTGGHLTGTSAEGSGELENGSSEIKSVTTSKGTFSAGQEISGASIPSGTKIQSVKGGGVLEISQPAEASDSGVVLSAHQSFSEYPSLNLPTQLAVDQSSGDLYVPDLLNGVVDVFDSSGNYLSQIGGLSFPSGVAINSANGDVYVSGFFGSVSVFDSSGSPVSSFSAAGNPTSLAVDPSSGAVFVTQSGGEVDVYSSGKFVKALDSNPSQSVAVDSSTGDVYVDEGKPGGEHLGEQIAQFDSSGNRLATLGSEDLTGSVGLAIDPEGNLYATNEAGIELALFTASLVPSTVIDNPAVLHAISEPATRHTADFQVAPSGNYAVFTSTLPLTGDDNAGHSEIYRYDALSDTLDCASCNPTGEQATGDATLASNGSSLTDDGRVFFNTTEGLVSRDFNDKMDVYEWENGNIDLISPGTSPSDSSLLGVSADGTDAYFFTRDTLVAQDHNGGQMRIYDARAGGGFPVGPPTFPCQAADECRGAGSSTPHPPDVNTTAGTPVGNVAPSKKHKHHHKHRRRRRASKHKRGGHK